LVDTANERNDTIKAASEIENSTLLKMGFQKEEDNWIFRRNVANRAENEAANPEDEEEENVDGVQHMDESPVHSFVNEDVVATSQNALVAYQELVHRGEPLSMFERQVLRRLDTLTYDQKEDYEITQARFQHFDDQIERVQEQLAELYHYNK